jgi:hypothetical protein
MSMCWPARLPFNPSTLSPMVLDVSDSGTPLTTSAMRQSVLIWAVS